MRPAPAGRGFSLVELVVVIAVTLILTSLLLPVLCQVREEVNRMMCSSNMRQIGFAVHMYSKDNKDELPRSLTLAERNMPQELMAAHLGDANVWDGLGLLYQTGYCGSPECFYCPSHKGEHHLDRHTWDYPKFATIYTNYHYSGNVDWATRGRRRSLQDTQLVLAVDGIRSQRDFNHETGMNMLRGDGSVRWFEDSSDEPFAAALPTGGIDAPDFNGLWDRIECLPR